MCSVPTRPAIRILDVGGSVAGMSASACWGRPTGRRKSTRKPVRWDTDQADNLGVDTVGTMEKLEAERLGEDVIIVRLSEPPGAGEWEWLLDSVHQYVGEAVLVILRGLGWAATPVARMMTDAVSHDLRATKGAQVAIDATV